MRHPTLILLALSFLDCGCRPPQSGRGTGDTPPTAGNSIEGKWVVVSSEVEGQPSPEDAVRYTKMTFSGEDATLEGQAQKHELRFYLDTTQRPKQIDLYSKQEKIRWKGIYQVEGT